MRMSCTYFSLDWTDSASLAECFLSIRHHTGQTYHVTLEGTLPDGRQFFIIAANEGIARSFTELASAGVHLTKHALKIQAGGGLKGLDLDEWLEDPDEPYGISLEEIYLEIHRSDGLYPTALVRTGLEVAEAPRLQSRFS